MAEKIIMPQGGQDIAEGRVVRWLKNEGETVAKGEVVCEVETEKAVFEVVSPMDGVLVKILVPAGKVAKIFAAIGVVAAPGEAVDFSALLGADEEAAAAAEAAAPAPPAAAVSDAARVKASGRARKLADEKGIDIARVSGSGPKGRITEKDVLAYAASLAAAAPAAPAAAPAPAGRGASIPHTKMRKVIARRLQQSKQTVPHFYVTVKVDVTAALGLRAEVNAKADGDGKISMNDLVVKAAAAALNAFPQMNCRFEEEALVLLENVNIGVAVGLDDGLVVPVIPDADHLSLKGIAKKTKELIALAKAGKQANLAPGTFTVSNMGMLGVENFIAIINPPETAILAVGAAVKEVQVADDMSLRIRDVMRMTLSADHRAVDGVLASRFLNRIKSGLENPQSLLG
jgi:pyruvate dehydrogenase E2 component (dihydrolipoamide acetyltransferase)